MCRLLENVTVFISTFEAICLDAIGFFYDVLRHRIPRRAMPRRAKTVKLATSQWP